MAETDFAPTPEAATSGLGDLELSLHAANTQVVLEQLQKALLVVQPTACSDADAGQPSPPQSAS